MPDVPIPPEPEPTTTEKMVERVNAIADSAEAMIRQTLTVSPTGRIRRPVLFVLAAIALGSAPVTPLTLIGIMAVMILALTDHVVADA